MKFWMVCGWDDYYPRGGIGNILAVFDDEAKAENYLKHLLDVEEDEEWMIMDNYEIFSSSDLPWGIEK